MVLLQLSEALRTRLEALSVHLPVELQLRVASHLQLDPDDDEDDSPESATAPATTTRDATIPHELLVEISQWARNRPGDEDLEDPDAHRLAQLLRLTDVYAPPLPERVKSPELLAILADIQLDQDRRSYSSMTSLAPAARPSLIPLNDPHTPFGGPTKSVAEEWSEIKRELGAIVNVTASMLAVGTAVWWVGGGRSYAARLGLALTGAIAIAAVEGFLYYRFFKALSAKEARDARAGGVAAELQKARLGSKGMFSVKRGLASSTTLEDKKGSRTTAGRLGKRS